MNSAMRIPQSDDSFNTTRYQTDKAMVIAQLGRFIGHLSADEMIKALRDAKDRKTGAGSVVEVIEGLSLATDQDALERLGECANVLGRLAEEIEYMESELKALKARQHEIRTQTMVDIMMEAQVSSISHDGKDYSIAPFVYGTWPKDPDKAADATRWLEENNAAGIIKAHVTAAFPKGSLQDAREIASRFPPEAGAKVETKVHPSTYKAFARERIRNGEPLDMDVLGITIGQVVNVRKARD